MAGDDKRIWDRIESLRARIDALRGSPHALEALHDTLDALATAVGELRARNEALARSEAALHTERVRYRDLFESAPDAYLVTDLEGVIEDANRAALALLGLQRTELIGTPLSTLLPAEDRTPFHRDLAELPRLGEAREWELRLRHGDSPSPVGADVCVACDEAGRPEGLHWLLRDATQPRAVVTALDRARSELEQRIRERTAELALANRQLRAEVAEHHQLEHEVRLLRSLALALARAPDLDAALGDALRHICETTGWQYGEAWLPDDSHYLKRGATWHRRDTRLKRFASRSRAVRFEKEQGLPGRVWASGRPEWLHDLSDGSLFRRASEAADAGLKVAVGVPVPSDRGVVAILVFFSGRRRAEDHRLLELVSTAVAPLGPVIERKRAEEERQRLNAELERRVAERTAELSRINEALEEQIAERQRTEQALRQNEARVQAIVDTAVESIITTDEGGIIESFNPAAERTFGYRAAEVIGRNVSMLMPPPHSERHDEYIERYLRTGEKRIIGVGGREVEGRRKDGSVFPMELAVGEFHDGEVRRFTGLARDITERRAMEEEARRHQAELAHVARLSTMGEMASSLAHELNQPLHAITAYCQACLRLLDSGAGDTAKLVRALEQASRQAQRAGEIIRRVRSFLRKTQTELAQVELNAVIRDVLSFNATSLRNADVTPRLDLAEDLPRVTVDPIQLEQVLLNLVRNGIDALLEVDGRPRELTIRTRRHDAGTLYVTVEDTGPGLDAETAEHVFDPFYTTKREGTGMGLSISRSIVEAHGGRLWVEPGTECGARFQFLLPLEPGLP